MFLFGEISLTSALMWVAVTAGLVLANEISRRNKIAAMLCFVALPLVLTIFVWPHTAGAGSSTGTWFHWVKVYSALAGCLGFFCLRHVKGWSTNKIVLCFPPLILAVNILEAVIRDFQCYSFNGVYDGVTIIGGPWNIMNGIAGILNIITITGWFGIYVSKGKSKDMMWPDMIWPWIIAYDLWNFAYVYNCVSDHAFYAGAALLVAPTLAHFFLKKGAWLQHRAHTLAFWMMFTMAFPAFVQDSQFAVKASHNTTAWFIVSFLALAANVAVLVLHVYRAVKYKKNVLKDDVYAGTKAYEEAANL